jgi:hypothetical protein
VTPEQDNVTELLPVRLVVRNTTQAPTPDEVAIGTF